MTCRESTYHIWDADRAIWVEQKHGNGCGAACLAMLTGRTYDEVLAELPEHSFYNDGVNDALMDAVLAGWGYAVARRYVGQGAAWWLAPFAERHLCTVDWGGGTYHYVVMLGDGTVLDPAREGCYRLTDYHSVLNVAAVVPIPPRTDSRPQG